MADSSRFLEAMVDSSQEAEAALRIGQEADQHYSLRIGDSVLLQSKGTEGYVFSELSRLARAVSSILAEYFGRSFMVVLY